MTRNVSLLIVCIGLFAVTLLTPAYAQNCRQWDATGRWAAVQNDNHAPAVEVTQTGDKFKGNAILNVFGTTSTRTQRAAVEGEIKGNRFFMIISWGGGRPGIYNGTVSDKGMISGTMVDATNRSNVVGWHTVAPMKCLETAKFGMSDCNEYVARAISQMQMGAGCNFTGARWAVNPTVLKSWCERASPVERADEDAARRQALATCTGRMGKIALDNCNEYAGRAMSQSDLQVTKGCGFSGGRWSRNFQEHLNFCNSMKGPVNWRVVEAEDKMRRDLIANCKRI